MPKAKTPVRTRSVGVQRLPRDCSPARGALPRGERGLRSEMAAPFHGGGSISSSIGAVRRGSSYPLRKGGGFGTASEGRGRSKPSSSSVEGAFDSDHQSLLEAVGNDSSKAASSSASPSTSYRRPDAPPFPFLAREAARSDGSSTLVGIATNGDSAQRTACRERERARRDAM